MTDDDEIDDQLIGVLALLKKQQSTIEALESQTVQQQKLLQQAAVDLDRVRQDFGLKLHDALQDLRNVPNTATESLKTAVAAAAGSATTESIRQSQESLKTSVNAATRRIDKINGESFAPALLAALVASLVSALVVVVGMWIAISQNLIKPNFVLDAQLVASHLLPALQQQQQASQPVRRR